MVELDSPESTAHFQMQRYEVLAVQVRPSIDSQECFCLPLPDLRTNRFPGRELWFRCVPTRCAYWIHDTVTLLPEMSAVPRVGRGLAVLDGRRSDFADGWRGGFLQTGQGSSTPSNGTPQRRSTYELQALIDEVFAQVSDGSTKTCRCAELPKVLQTFEKRRGLMILSEDEMASLKAFATDVRRSDLIGTYSCPS